MYETEPARLQREADDYTKNLEHERKRDLIIGDLYRQTKEQLDEIKGKIKEKIPNEVLEHREKVKLKSLHHGLANEKVLYNKTFGENRKLITKINIMRAELKFAKASIDDMEKTIISLR